MKQNVGKIDRIVRIVAGLGLLSLLFVLDGDARWIGLLGALPLASAITGVCCLYIPLGINTHCCRKNADGTEKKSACCGGGCSTEK